MGNVRWESPFPYSLAFNLFKQHFEEINRSYWAFVPTVYTIKTLAKENLSDDYADSKNFLNFQMKKSTGNFFSSFSRCAAKIQYLYSAALIDYITKKLETNSNSIMEELNKDKI